MQAPCVGLVMLIVVGSCAGPAAAPPPRDPGITTAPTAVDAAVTAAAPTPPALRLPASFQPVRYRAHLAIDPAQPTFTGAIAIEATLSEASPLIWLHGERLDVTSARAEIAGASVELEALTFAPDLIALRAARALPVGHVTLHLEYRGRIDPVEALGAFVQSVEADRYVITQLEALGARRVFPCLDEPSSKVPWQLTLDVPAGQVALSNTPVTGEEALDDGGRRVTFAETPPLPSYLVAFAVGPFELIDAGATRSGAPIRIAAFRGQTARTAFAVESTARVVQILEDWFGTPYPYAKLDIVPIPSTIWFGAMENAGMITCLGELMLLDPAANTEEQRQGYVSLMAHEAAHQWFGDLVTMSWWDDVWLNEAFATWMEAKVMTVYDASWAPPASAVADRSWALDADGLTTARAIRQPIVTAADIESAFDAITYSKGAAVLRMFEAQVGAADFRAGVQAYLARHAWGSATSDDFLTAIDEATPLELGPAFRALLDQSGAPRVTAELTCAKGAASVVTLRQDRWLPRGAIAPAGPTPRWQLPVCVAYGTGKRRQEACTVLADDAATVELTGACPAWFLPNARGTGYFRMSLSADALDALLAAGWKRLLPEERVLVATDVDAMVARGDLSVGASLALVPRLLGSGARDEVVRAAAAVVRAATIASDDARPALARWIRKTMGARARKLGWLPGKQRDLDTELARSELVPLVASHGRDPVLLDQAVKLAKRWRDLPEAHRAGVLRAAARRSPAVSAELIAELPLITDVQLRRDVVVALGGIDDPIRAAEALAVLLDPRVDLKDAIRLLVRVAEHPAVQPVAEAFLREHFDELAPRIPDSILARLVLTLTASCDAGKRADAAAWATAHLAPAAGGPRTVAQALERMDLCIARKAAQGPELDAWLTAQKP